MKSRVPEKFPYTADKWQRALMAAITVRRGGKTDRPFEELSPGLQRVWLAEAHKLVLAVALELHKDA